MRLSQLVNFARNLLFYLRQVFCPPPAPRLPLPPCTSCSPSNSKRAKLFTFCSLPHSLVKFLQLQVPAPGSGPGSGPGTFPAALPGECSVAVCRCWHCGCHKTLLFVLDQSCGCYHAECHKTCIALHAIDNGNDSANSNNNNNSGHNNCDDNVDAAVGKCLLNLRPALTSSASTSASASALRQRWVCAASTVAPDRVTAASKLGALALTTLAANESPKINMPVSSRLGCKSIWS